MKNLLELAMSATQKNITKGRSSRKSINDSLLELLYGKDGKPMTKLEVVGAISLERLHSEFEGEVTAKNFGSDEVQKEFKRINKTVSNGFDTAVCAGKTSASFCSNKRFENYELVKNANGTYEIVDATITE